MADTIPQAPIVPSAWNRWLLAANMDPRDTDQMHKVAEFFRARVFPVAGIDESYLAQLSISPVTGLPLVKSLPGGIPPINGQVDLIPVRFWAPATAKSIPWPFDPIVDIWSPADVFLSELYTGQQERTILYQIFKADVKAPNPKELQEQEQQERPEHEPENWVEELDQSLGVAMGKVVKVGALFGAGALLWRFLGRNAPK